MSKFYVYAHLKPNEDTPFYIGKGTGNRSISKKSRSQHWKNITNKYGLVVKIIKDGMSEHEAVELEKQLIKEYGRKDMGTGVLINRTDGGEGGGSGRIISEETREKIRNSKLGKKRSKEFCKIMSKLHKGKTISEEMKKHLSKINKGKEPWNKGKPAWNKGIPMSEESKKKLSQSRRELFKRIKDEKSKGYIS